eukprot:6186947-Pleurochrysis_carterae.AAC.1
MFRHHNATSAVAMGEREKRVGMEGETKRGRQGKRWTGGEREKRVGMEGETKRGRQGKRSTGGQREIGRGRQERQTEEAEEGRDERWEGQTGREELIGWVHEETAGGSQRVRGARLSN